MPINLAVIKAQQELQYALDQITVKYQLPGAIMGMILESVRAKELKEQLTLLAMQISTEAENEDKPENTEG